MKVTYFVTTDGGCDYYRSVLPLETANGHGMECTKIWPQNLIYDFNENINKLDKYMRADIFHFSRSTNKDFGAKLSNIIKLNKYGKIVCDYDDDIFNISPLNPHYYENGTEEAKALVDGKYIDLWVDGKNIDIKKNRKKMAAAKEAIASCDLLTVTTEYLKNQWKDLNENIKVLPNCVDALEMKRLPIKNDKIKIFWAGGHSHYEDLVIVKDVIIDIVNKYKDVELVIMGQLFPGLFKDIPKERVKYLNWVNTAAYHYKLMTVNPDICFIPLKDTKFNRCKSAIKWIEMAALEVPSVSTYIPPYSLMAELDEDNGIYIENNNQELWYQGLKKLIEDETFRKETGKRARKTVEDHFDINKRYIDWVKAYEEVLWQSPQTLQLVN